MSDPDVDYLSIFIKEAGSAAKLLKEHAPVDGRCTRCRSSDSSGYELAPCTLYRAAVAAAEQCP